MKLLVALCCALLCSTAAAVQNETALRSSIANERTVVQFEADVSLTQTVEIGSSMTVNGNGFTLNGNNNVQCLTMSTGGITVTIIELTIFGGSSDESNGAGIYVSDSNLVMETCNISGNVLSGTSNRGAALAVENDGTATLIDCTIANNGAASGANNYGGAMWFGAGASGLLTRCWITSSYNAKYGGAVAVTDDASVTFSMSTFTENTPKSGTSYGSCFYVRDTGAIVLSACTLASDQSVYLNSGASIVHHSGCSANTSLSGSGNRDSTVSCTDSSSSWCSSSTLVADLRTNASCSACAVGKSSCCGAIACTALSNYGTCSSDYCPSPDPTFRPSWSPSWRPTRHPTPAPSASDLTLVEVGLSIGASSAEPSKSGASALRTAVADAAGVSSLSGLKNVSLLGDAQNSRRRMAAAVNDDSAYSWTFTCSVAFSIAEKVPALFSSADDFASDLGAVLGSSVFSVFVASSVPNATGVTAASATLVVFVDSTSGLPTSSPSMLRSASPTLIPTTVAQKSMLGAYLAVAAALFTAGLAIGFARGAMTKPVTRTGSKAAKSTSVVEKWFIKRSEESTRTTQKKRPGRGEQVVVLEVPPEACSETVVSTDLLPQKKIIPEKKRPLPNDSDLRVLQFKTGTRAPIAGEIDTIGKYKPEDTKNNQTVKKKLTDEGTADQ